MNAETLKAIDLAKESSDRARGVLLVMQVTCIVVFIAAWHEAPFSWNYARLRTAQAAVWYLDCSVQEHPEIQGTAVTTSISAPGPATQTIAHPDLRETPPAVTQAHDRCHLLSGPFSPTELNAAREFIAQWNFTPAQARKHLDELQSSIVNRQINVSAPFLGITFDVNDLSLLGGLSFLLILVWLYFSVRREELNVATLFYGRSEDDLEEVYKLAGMTQVLTVTPRAGGRGSGAKVGALAWLLRLLFFTPLLVQGFVLGIDWETANRGRAVSLPLNTWEDLCAFSITLAMAFATWRCRRRSAAVDTNWNEANSRRSQVAPAGAAPAPGSEVSGL